MPSVEDSLLKAIAKLLKSTIQQSIYEVYELANQWCASKPKQRPDMAHVFSVLSLLIGEWKPSIEIQDLDNDTFRPEILAYRVHAMRGNIGILWCDILSRNCLF